MPFVLCIFFGVWLWWSWLAESIEELKFRFVGILQLMKDICGPLVVHLMSEELLNKEWTNDLF